MTQEKIDRINALAKKAATPPGLTVQEREEQAALRAEYLAAIKSNLNAQLDHTYIQYPDGTRRKLERKADKT